MIAAAPAAASVGESAAGVSGAKRVEPGGVGVRRLSRTPGKLAEQLALRIEAEVLAAGWPVGANLGSESDLLARYGVSRSILREAVRITEYLGLAKMRRGPGGGLIVTAPDPSAVMTAVVVYLSFRQVRLEHVIQARHPIEELAVRAAAERRTPADVNAMWGRLALELAGPRDDHWVLHDVLASVSGNPAIELFVEILSRVTAQYTPNGTLAPAIRRRRLEESVRAHRALVEAVAVGDGDGAAIRVHEHLDAIEHVLTRMLSSPAASLADLRSRDRDGSKRSIGVAGRIFADIVSRRWPVGQHLGTEPELQQLYGVGRAVLREALRLLEWNHVITTRRGPGGGVLVGTPDEGATTEAMAVYLASRGITLPQLFEVREAVEMAVVDLAVADFGSEEVQILWDTLAEEEAAPVGSLGTFPHRLHLRLAQLTGNDALVLCLHALTRLTEQHQTELPGALSLDEGAASVLRAHRAIVRAIATGDAAKAKRKMQIHLGALPGMLAQELPGPADPLARGAGARRA